MLYVRGSTSAVTLSATTAANNAQVTGTVATQDTDLELWDQVDLVVTEGTTVTTLAPWALYLVPDTVDDANTPGFSTPPSAIYLVAQWPTASGTSAQRFTAHGIALPPGEFTYIIYNGSGQSASSIALNRRPYHVA